jgi:hypothetical protein
VHLNKYATLGNLIFSWATCLIAGSRNPAIIGCMSPALKLLFQFVFHIFIGTVLFGAVAGAAIGLWYVTDLMQAGGVPYEIWIVCHFVTELLFWLDVLCLVFFVVVEVWKLLREIWQSLRATGVENAR